MWTWTSLYYTCAGTTTSGECPECPDVSGGVGTPYPVYVQTLTASNNVNILSADISKEALTADLVYEGLEAEIVDIQEAGIN